MTSTKVRRTPEDLDADFVETQPGHQRWWPIKVNIDGPGGTLPEFEWETSTLGNNTIPCWQRLKNAGLPRGVYRYKVDAPLCQVHATNCWDWDKPDQLQLAILSVSASAPVLLYGDVYTVSLQVEYSVAGKPAARPFMVIYDAPFEPVAARWLGDDHSGEELAVGEYRYDPDPQQDRSEHFDLELNFDQLGELTVVLYGEQRACDAAQDNRDRQPKLARQGLAATWAVQCYLKQVSYGGPQYKEVAKDDGSGPYDRPTGRTTPSIRIAMPRTRAIARMRSALCGGPGSALPESPFRSRRTLSAAGRSSGEWGRTASPTTPPAPCWPR